MPRGKLSLEAREMLYKNKKKLPINSKVDKDLLKDFKHFCDKKGLSMTLVFETFMEKYIKGEVIL